MGSQEKSISLEIISPERTLLKCNVRSAEFPGTLGPFMVLCDHAPLISSLEKGLIRYTCEDGSRQDIRILSGFVTVGGNSIKACVELP